MLIRPKVVILAVVSSAMMVLGVASPADASLASGTGTFSIFNQNSFKCLGISNGLAGQWTCSLGNDQSWHWGAAKPGRPDYRRLVNANGLCLAVNGQSKANGARILGYACTGTADQYWSTLSVGGGDVEIVNFNSGRVVGVAGGSKANGAAVVQWINLNHLDQYWS
jgi:uncharacterized protein